MVTVKREVPAESASPAHNPRHDLGHFGTSPPTGGVPDIPIPQVPWRKPQNKPFPGPQEEFEFEFQVVPPIWPTPPTAQIKSPNRTVPTLLDQYALKLPRSEECSGRRVLENEQANNSNRAAFPHMEGRYGACGKDYELQSKVLELHNRQRLQVQRFDGVSDRSFEGPASGKSWTPPPGWEESLLPEYQRALGYLRQQSKKRLSSASQEQNATSRCHTNFSPESTTVDREQSTDSDWRIEYTPESTPGYPETAGLQIKLEFGHSPTETGKTNR